VLNFALRPVDIQSARNNANCGASPDLAIIHATGMMQADFFRECRAGIKKN
jgi:hypothetical protein